MLGSIISLVVEAALSIKIVDRVNKTSFSDMTIAEILGLSAMAGGLLGICNGKNIRQERNGGCNPWRFGLSRNNWVVGALLRIRGNIEAV